MILVATVDAAFSHGQMRKSTKTKPKKPLEAWQAEDAQRLKALWESRPEPKLSQAEFGATYALGTQGNVWQYLNGEIPLNLSAAIRFAQGLKCKVSDISPTLAADLDRIAPATLEGRAALVAKVPSMPA